ncbi:fimbrial protein [Escherichia coli]|nr:fimbrial protein [Escherichia coli]
MKKLILATAIAMASFSALASQGEVRFFGNVTSATCDVTPVVDGHVTDMIQLGTVKTNATGEEIPFSFKATNASGEECPSLTGKTATITWSGPITDQGIANQTGLAEDAYVILRAENATDGNDAITTAKNSSQFNAEKAISDGFQFTAQLQGGATPGDFETAAAYAVTYQ